MLGADRSGHTRGGLPQLGVKSRREAGMGGGGENRHPLVF